MAKVMQRSAGGIPGRLRTLFEAPEKDARTYIERNFPRAHVEPPNQEPGIPDVHLVADDGSTHTYHAENGWTEESPAVPTTPGLAGTEESPVVPTTPGLAG
jgi:hypothetical protein